MVLPWRRRQRKRRQGGKMELSGDIAGGETKIPVDFLCPISLELMKDPVTLSTGITYDRKNIARWFESGKKTCPVTNQRLDSTDRTMPIPNHTMRRMIQDWCVDHRSFGIDRIPTPRVPLTPRDVSEICMALDDAISRGDDVQCLEIVGRIKNVGRESDRNKNCLAQNGVVSVLSSCFETFSSERHVALSEEVMSVLAWLLPVRSEGFSKIMVSTASLRFMVRFLNSGDPSARQNAAFLLREVVFSDTSYVHALTGIEGASEGLAKLIKNPICPSSTKSSLLVIYHMISDSRTRDKTIAAFVQMGLVSMMTEMIVSTEKSISEKALVVLDVISEDEKGREELWRNDLIVPVLVKKILRVSDLATKCSISILWKLGKKEKEEEERVLVEALQVGAFEKLLVVLQVGCEDETREKASELLRSLNLHKNETDTKCNVDSSMRFKYVKRSF